MYSFAWRAQPYSYKLASRPLFAPILKLQRIESMLMDSGREPDSPRQCADCGVPTGRASRCFRCSSAALNFDGDLARLRNSLNNNNHNMTQIMEEGALLDDPRDNNNRIQQPIEILTHRASANTNDNNIPGDTRINTNTFPDNFNRFRMSSYNWGVWGCFIFITVLLFPAHIFLKKYDYRGELLGIILVSTILLMVCFSVSMFQSKTRLILMHRLHLEDNIRPYPSSESPTIRRQLHRRNLRISSRRLRNRYNYPLRRVRSTPEFQVQNLRCSQRTAAAACNIPRVHLGRRSSRNSVLGGHDNNLDPPPYHLAILLPSPPLDVYTRRCETPPPSYDQL